MYKSHYHFNQTEKIPYNVMKAWVKELFTAQGINDNTADVVAESLVDADARGVYSHGVQRVKMYSARIQKDCINRNGVPHIIKDADATAVVDGDNAMGQIVGVFSMQLAIEKAKKYGIGIVTARNSNHYGRCAYYSRMALDENMIGFSSTVGGGNLMAPWGGTSPRVGNNPFSVAMPADKKNPVVLDMAQSVVAKGKIEMAVKTGSPIPAEWALDSNGIPTTDAKKGSEGTLRPIADYKGSGIAITVGMMSSMLSGGALGASLKNVYKDFDGGLNKGQLFIAIDIAHFIDAEAYKERMDKEIEFIKESPLAADTDEIYMPGEIEYNNYYRQISDGITYAKEVMDELKELSSKLNVHIPDAV